MGANFSEGSFAALTNVRSGMQRPEGRSRGELVTSAIGCTANVDAQSPQFSAFNLWSGRVKSEGEAELDFTRSWPAPGSPSGWQSASSRVPNGVLIVTVHSNRAFGDRWDDSWCKALWLRAGFGELPVTATVESLRGAVGVVGAHVTPSSRRGHSLDPTELQWNDAPNHKSRRSRRIAVLARVFRDKLRWLWR